MDSFTLASFLHLAARLVIGAAVVTFCMGLGEWAIDYRLKKAVKAFVDAANMYVNSEGKSGTVWPLLAFTLGAPAILAYLLG